MKLFFIYGTTAELIKIIHVVVKCRSTMEVKLYCTNQQKKELQKFHQKLNIEPDFIGLGYNSWNGLSYKYQVVEWMTKNWNFLRKILKKVSNDTHIVVQGDTLSALIGSLVAKFYKLKLIHIEAGLRSGRVFDPFPEEITRRIISHLADLNFAPNGIALNNLKIVKGIKINTFHNTGIDFLIKTINEFKISGRVIPKEVYCLVTLHRTELIANKEVLIRTIAEIRDLSKYIKCKVVFDSHIYINLLKNDYLNELFNLENVELHNKINYEDFLFILINSEFVITDSGGIQEECSFLGKPVLIHRRSTERVDGIGKNARLSGWLDGEIAYFYKNYKSYVRQPEQIKKSPSAIIYEYLN
jgi:UDP-N-acetylglucosamine 2-epimerase (non-hydrolysing)